MKRIAYTIIDNGIEGKEKDSITEAFWFEDERDAFLEKDPNKAWRRKGEVIVDTVDVRRKALAKLNGLDMLALNMDIRGYFSPANALTAATKPT